MVLPQSVSCTLSAVWRDAAGVLPSTHFTGFSKVILAGETCKLILFSADGATPICTVDLTDPGAVMFFQKFAAVGEVLATALVAR